MSFQSLQGQGQKSLNVISGHFSLFHIRHQLRLFQVILEITQGHFRSFWKSFKVILGHFGNHSRSFQVILGHFRNHSRSFQVILGHFGNHSRSFQVILGHFRNHSRSFQVIFQTTTQQLPFPNTSAIYLKSSTLSIEPMYSTFPCESDSNETTPAVLVFQFPAVQKVLCQ